MSKSKECCKNFQTLKFIICLRGMEINRIEATKIHVTYLLQNLRDIYSHFGNLKTNVNNLMLFRKV